MKYKNTAMITSLMLIAILVQSIVSSDESDQTANISAVGGAEEKTVLASGLKGSQLNASVLPNATSVNSAIDFAAVTADYRDTLSSEPIGAIARMRAIQDKNELHKATLNDFDTFTRYPSNNIRIERPEQDPIMMRYDIDERTTRNDDRSESMTIWSDKKFYQRGDLVTVFAKLQDANGVSIPSRFSAQLIYNERRSIEVFDLNDTNADGLHEMSFIADELKEKEIPAGNYKVLIVNETNDIADAVVFSLTDPTAKFTGNYRDSLSKGNLIIEAEIDVSSDDRFYFQASLYTELGEPIGTTQLTDNFVKGKQWVPLEFYGLMLHDVAVDGPYVLKNLAMARVTMPMQRAPMIHPEYFTKSYELSKFASTKFSDIAQLN